VVIEIGVFEIASLERDFDVVEPGATER